MSFILRAKMHFPKSTFRPLSAVCASPLGGVLRAGAVVMALGMAQWCAAAPVDLDPLVRLLQEKESASTASEAGGVVKRVRDTASDLVVSAMNFLGVPYRWGGTSAESGFDCSGFTRHVFEQSLGLLLPRRAAEQANSAGLLSVQSSELKPGDLVFFNTMRRAFSHVGIYVGDNKFIHAPRTGSHVKIDDLSSSYWQKHFDGARRVPQLTTGTFRLPADLFSVGKDGARQD